jgi:hypothetical protein
VLTVVRRDEHHQARVRRGSLGTFDEPFELFVQRTNLRRVALPVLARAKHPFEHLIGGDASEALVVVEQGQRIIRRVAQ